jgi:hypothetical protein
MPCIAAYPAIKKIDRAAPEALATKTSSDANDNPDWLSCDTTYTPRVDPATALPIIEGRCEKPPTGSFGIGAMAKEGQGLGNAPHSRAIRLVSWTGMEIVVLSHSKRGCDAWKLP